MGRETSGMARPGPHAMLAQAPCVPCSVTRLSSQQQPRTSSHPGLSQGGQTPGRLRPCPLCLPLHGTSAEWGRKDTYGWMSPARAGWKGGKAPTGWCTPGPLCLPGSLASIEHRQRSLAVQSPGQVLSVRAGKCCAPGKAQEQEVPGASCRGLHLLMQGLRGPSDSHPQGHPEAPVSLGPGSQV